MKIDQLLTEANIAAKLKDPKTIKMLGIAMRHDATLPRRKVAALGGAIFKQEMDPKKQAENDQKILALWSELLDDSLRSTDYGDISIDGKFDDWLTRLYINGIVEYEDINGEGGDALGAWKALSIRGKLKPEHQDFNKFRSLKQLQAVVQKREYRDELARIKDAETIEKHKRERKEIVVLDDEKFLAVIPLNYGSCYTFNNSAGFQASFCTGSSSGARWFERYAPEGPIISILDKENTEDENSKWQIHAPTGQMNNGNQTITYSRGDAKVAELFPGLMKKIVAGMKANAEEIRAASKEIKPGGYDITAAIEELKDKFPKSFASGEKEPEPEPEPEQAPEGEERTYVVTLLATGRQARVQGTSEDDVIRKVRERHPDIQPEELRVEPAENEQ
jgi:hypothetical protein